jgi:hypothetical protein
LSGLFACSGTRRRHVAGRTGFSVPLLKEGVGLSPTAFFLFAWACSGEAHKAAGAGGRLREARKAFVVSRGDEKRGPLVSADRLRQEGQVRVIDSGACLAPAERVISSVASSRFYRGFPAGSRVPRLPEHVGSDSQTCLPNGSLGCSLKVLFSLDRHVGAILGPHNLHFAIEGSLISAATGFHVVTRLCGSSLHAIPKH